MSVSNYGIGFLELLQLMFIFLKLNGSITWSWIMVLPSNAAVKCRVA